MKYFKLAYTTGFADTTVNDEESVAQRISLAKKSHAVVVDAIKETVFANSS